MEQATVGSVVSEEVARALLEPHRDVIGLAFGRGWADWGQLGRRAPAQRLHLGRTSRATSVNDLICAHVETLLTGRPGVTMVREHGRLVAYLGGGMVKLRFKKLDRRLRASNIPTGRQLRLRLQLEQPALPGMPSPTVLTVGYLLDLTETSIRRIVAVCRVGAMLEYAIDLPVPTSAQVAGVAEPARVAVDPEALAPVVRSSRPERTGRERGGAS